MYHIARIKQDGGQTFGDANVTWHWPGLPWHDMTWIRAWTVCQGTHVWWMALIGNVCWHVTASAVRPQGAVGCGQHNIEDYKQCTLSMGFAVEGMSSHAVKLEVYGYSPADIHTWSWQSDNENCSMCWWWLIVHHGICFCITVAPHCPSLSLDGATLHGCCSRDVQEKEKMGTVARTFADHMAFLLGYPLLRWCAMSGAVNDSMDILHMEPPSCCWID